MSETMKDRRNSLYLFLGFLRELSTNCSLGEEIRKQATQHITTLELELREQEASLPPLTSAQKNAYLANPTKCPFCGSSEISGEGWEPEGNYESVSCTSCGRRWNDCYILKSVEEAEARSWAKRELRTNMWFK